MVHTSKLRSIKQTLMKKTCPFIYTTRKTVLFDTKTPSNAKIKDTLWTHVAVKIFLYKNSILWFTLVLIKKGLNHYNFFF